MKGPLLPFFVFMISVSVGMGVVNIYNAFHLQPRAAYLGVLGMFSILTPMFSVVVWRMKRPIILHHRTIVVIESGACDKEPQIQKQ